MKAVLIADTHGLHDQVRVPNGDMLIVAGDFTNTGKSTQVAKAAVWLGSLPHKHKIVVAGNHDFYFERKPAHAAALLAEHGITYLQDTGVNVEGLLVYGSPWQPAFMNWAFNVPRGRLGRYWEQIPAGLDMLITHGTPFGVLDQAIPGRTDHVGCEELLSAVEKTKPRVHVFGHIHGSYGTMKNEHTTFYNASLANERYEIANQALVIDLEREAWSILRLSASRRRRLTGVLTKLWPPDVWAALFSIAMTRKQESPSDWTELRYMLSELITDSSRARADELLRYLCSARSRDR